MSLTPKANHTSFTTNVRSFRQQVRKARPLACFFGFQNTSGDRAARAWGQSPHPGRRAAPAPLRARQRAPPDHSFLAAFFAGAFFAAGFFAAGFLAAAFFAGFFFDFAAISSSACSMVRSAGSTSFGRVALTFSHFT